MSLTDRVFSKIPGPLISKWGISATYIKTGGQQDYDPETGRLTEKEVRVPIKLLPAKVQIGDVKGEVQITDTKMLIAGEALGDYYPKITDKIEYTQGGIKRTARIVDPRVVRGESPIVFSIIVRTT